MGCGLNALLAQRSANLHGILNGIDPELWNPANDPHLATHFSAQDVAGKREVKAALLKEFGLPAERIERPLIGVVARLAKQKGLDLLSQNPPQFLDLDATLIVAGDGNPQEEDFFAGWRRPILPGWLSESASHRSKPPNSCRVGCISNAKP